jgi:hypothetical protein
VRLWTSRKTDTCLTWLVKYDRWLIKPICVSRFQFESIMRSNRIPNVHIRDAAELAIAHVMRRISS